MSGRKYKQKRPTIDLSRRNFLKTVAVAGVSVTTAGTLAKKVSTLVLQDGPQGAPLDYILRGDRILMGREYILMTETEKKTMVGTFTDNYKKLS
jgi:hypothetical protein